MLTAYMGFSCCKAPQCNWRKHHHSWHLWETEKSKEGTANRHFKGNWTTVNWLVWKDLYSKTGLPFCSWTVCKASWNTLQWASGLEKLELSQFLHQCWPPSGKPAAIFLFRTSPRQDGQQLFLCSDFGEHWELWQCDHCHYKKKSILMSNYWGDMELLLCCLLGTWVDGCCAKIFWCSNSWCLMLLLSF